jgi:hypothetical protein
MGAVLANVEATASTNISPEIETNLNMGGFVMLINNLVIILIVGVLVLAYMFSKYCCKHMVTLATLTFLIVGCLLVLSKEYESSEQDAKAIPFLVPITAFLLGIAASTLWIAFLKWYRSSRASNDNNEEQTNGSNNEAPNASNGEASNASNGEAHGTSDRVSGNGISKTFLPSLLNGLGLAGASSNSHPSHVHSDGDDSRVQLLFKNQQVVVFRDTPDLDEEAQVQLGTHATKNK